MLARIAVCSMVLAAGPVAGPANAGPPAIEIVDWGIVERAPTVGTAPSDTLIGRNRLVDPNAEIAIAERTTEVDACPGTRFGILFRRPGGAASRPLAVEVAVHHPEQVAPDGRRRTVSRWQATASGRVRYTGWQFEKPYELVAGTWTFVISADGRELARQSFTVRRASCAVVS